MNYIVSHLKLFHYLLIIAALLSGCSHETNTEKDFVGKWKSSRLETPVYLYENGEWEIKTESGAILQYGVWQYKAGFITWSFKVNSQVGHDVNPVLSVTPREFQVRENDGSTTTFTKLD